MEGNLSFGFLGDDAEFSDRFTVDAAANISRDSYPHETRFTLESRVTMEDGESTDDVKKLRVNQDYDVTYFFEVFGFGELFSDQFMKINQRYEVGIGCKLQWQCWDEDSEYRVLTNAVHYVDVVVDWAERMGRVPSDEKSPASKILQDMADLQAAKDVAKRNYELRRRQKRWLSLAFAAALIADLERPSELSIKIKSAKGESTVSLKPADNFRYRLNLRPSISWKVADNLSIYLKSLLKFPIVNDWYIRDIRVDTELLADLKTSKNISVTAKFNQYFDNIPPELSIAQVSQYEVLSKTRAPERHSQIVLAIKYSF